MGSRKLEIREIELLVEELGDAEAEAVRGGMEVQIDRVQTTVDDGSSGGLSSGVIQAIISSLLRR